eukprot:CAMPEP_0201489110 /NCGR_PEP_ID=MMETSP0151_2-20130828/21029_1 /ASSEMBLY_ACC=CAM_ASM_000257 /TAXON_ID=200890 /ORGANISM="Paramoeba atlantica, Strain 621/1 / CCAP 1560/9" /LENGTH=128 /DNA_ID=CAMNT_0047874591 /DNA_START=6 /DNA_END=392 /DNA_ORIENTATION=-
MANPPQPVFINPETDPEKLRELSSKVFENVGDYLNAEFTACSEDFKLLEDMNRVSTEKYAKMADKAVLLGKEMDLIQKKYEEMKPYLQQIDEIDAAVDELQTTVEALDIYTQRLDSRLRDVSQSLASK